MSVRRGAPVTIVIGLCAALLACASADASTATGPDPTVREWPEWPYQTQCDGLPFDPVQAFSGPTGAELGSLPSEIALREFLHSGELPWVRTHDWRLIAEEGGIAEFAHGRLAAAVEWLTLERTEGKWHFVGYASDCEPRSIVGHGTVVTWSLARKQGLLKPGSRTLWIELGPGECASGARQNPRAHFVFKRMGRKLLMTAWLTPVGPGGHTCQGTVEPPRKVKLPSRLGHSVLYDAATYPPLRAGQTRSAER